MAVYMFRVFIGKGSMSLSDLETGINDWVASNPQWENDTVEHSLSERNTELDGTGATYYGIDVRFREDDTKSNLLQKLSDKVENKVSWYRVGYHSCSHDESTPHACSWDDSDEWAEKDVTIPDGVPTFL